MKSRAGFLSRRIATAALALSCMALSAARAEGLPRIVSMNACTDQLLIALADPGQILGISRFARDAWQSRMGGDPRDYRVLSGAEEVLVLRPDIVVASLFDRRTTRELLKAKGFHLEEFGVPNSLDEVKDQIRRMEDIVGHPDRAAAEIARLDQALARARQAMSGKHYSVLPLQRRGWVTGSDSLLGSLLSEVGLSNAAGELGVTSGGYATLEAIVNARPDFIVVSEAGDHAPDEGSAFLLHPALERFYPASKRIVIPDRLAVCGGVLLADALDRLVTELERVGR
ncbi:ABC transporter substrate-binding protein [Bradyrhizobium sp. dw_78]|uniref:ABC transporter substrate-binding protein n=1 Tax=Bradyrhizobium sp. dw_78 TaxID=2719793 RepID=UPI001BD4334C|nr:ABC transporter substrate-binding protein [Bradyrhizobium sp. dw_78]